MTDINHRRGGTKTAYPYLTRLAMTFDGTPFVDQYLHNGYPPRATQAGKHWGYIDKSLHSWGDRSRFSDKSVGATIGNDFTNGNRGMAKSVRGAKKFVRTRIRFHDKQKVREIIKSGDHDAD